jgi:hypothetical protein
VGEYIRTTPDGHIWWNRGKPEPGLYRNIPILTVDRYLADNKIDSLAILHSDIQGQERVMLEGAKRSFTEGRIGFVFISTHGDDVHQECADWLRSAQYLILAEHNQADSFSADGLIVARSPDCPGPDKIEISKRSEACQI